MTNLRGMSTLATLAMLAMLAVLAVPAHGQVAAGKIDPDGLTFEDIQRAMPEYFQVDGNNGRVRPMDIPDVFGPGAVLTVGNVYMKVTNWGHLGNLFTNVSSDPGGQWPGSSAIEYLSSIRLSVGAVNPTASDPLSVRRVSYLLEWRPASLLPEDKIYRAYDGVINGARFVDDDGGGVDRFFDPYVDEDFLDGHDNDGDGDIDEDYGALGQQMYSCVMRDDTPQAVALVQAEKHVPLGLECKQVAWAYSIPGFTDFNAIEYTITNVSGHELDSLVIGWLVDNDAGPIASSNYFQDDFDLPFFPHGEFRIPLDNNDPRRQFPHAPEVPGASDDDPLCTDLNIRINGFSTTDDDGDDGRTSGIPSFLLIDHTIDPLGVNGPWRVGFRSFRSFTSGTPYVQGGNPTIDQQRFELMTGTENVDVSEDPADRYRDDGPTGWITAEPGDQKGDYLQWCSVGPWYHIPPGGSVKATIAFAIKRGRYIDALRYRLDYAAYELGQVSRDVLQQRYPGLDNAISAQVAFEGIYELRDSYPQTDFHGRETARVGDIGTLAEPVIEPACEARNTDAKTVFVDSNKYYWFDMDCDYCTGVYDWGSKQGLFHKIWNAEAPPPNPNTNLSVRYNYTDNPERVVAAAGDRTITVAWDNLSESTPDPKSQWFDFRGYKIWKVASWSRPVGSPGPSEDDWALVGEFRKFEYRGTNGALIPDNRRWEKITATDSVLRSPLIYIPNYLDPNTGVRGPATVRLYLELGDLWDRQTGQIIKPTPMPCVPGEVDSCALGVGGRLGSAPVIPETVKRYPVGRYRYVDTEVKNGFLYFYSVTSFDSTGSLTQMTELNGRRSAVESEGVTPQIGTRTGKSVWVVPNPYRGFAQIAQRSSSWDLTPNSSDPTGTHIDFMGLPAGEWTIRIYTVSGDLVQILTSNDAVNESIRPTVTDDSGTDRPGYNRQQDTANDGQASWNLISRNGQDIVSGIYIFTVESSQGTQRGKFVVIR